MQDQAGIEVAGHAADGLAVGGVPEAASPALPIRDLDAELSEDILSHGIPLYFDDLVKIVLKVKQRF